MFGSRVITFWGAVSDPKFWLIKDAGYRRSCSCEGLIVSSVYFTFIPSLSHSCSMLVCICGMWMLLSSAVHVVILRWRYKFTPSQKKVKSHQVCSERTEVNSLKFSFSSLSVSSFWMSSRSLNPGSGWPMSLRRSPSSCLEIFPSPFLSIKTQKESSDMVTPAGTMTAIKRNMTFTHRNFQISVLSPPFLLVLALQTFFWDWPEVVSQRKVWLWREQSHNILKIVWEANSIFITRAKLTQTAVTFCAFNQQREWHRHTADKWTFYFLSGLK